MLAPLALMLDQAFRSTGVRYEENEAREIRRQIEQLEVTILYDVTQNDHITHVISKAFVSTDLVLAGLTWACV